MRSPINAIASLFTSYRSDSDPSFVPSPPSSPRDSNNDDDLPPDMAKIENDDNIPPPLPLSNIHDPRPVGYISRDKLTHEDYIKTKGRKKKSEKPIYRIIAKYHLSYNSTSLRETKQKCVEDVLHDYLQEFPNARFLRPCKGDKNHFHVMDQSEIHLTICNLLVKCKDDPSIVVLVMYVVTPSII